MRIYKAKEDDRLDPRIKSLLSALEYARPAITDVPDRETLLLESNSFKEKAKMKLLEGILNKADTEAIAPSDGLMIKTLCFYSSPDNNEIKIQWIRPDNDDVLPCIYYIHGGGMQFMSCFWGNYRAWGKILAKQNLAVAMVDFRNCVVPSSAPDVAPFPAGLNDCVSGLKWISEKSGELKVDSQNIFIAGESGGGNLSIATTMKIVRDEKNNTLIKGLYALCPYIAGIWPLEKNPSSIENEGILLTLANNRGAMAYGIEELKNENPLAWPGFATQNDVIDFPPTMISVNECDPLRDEGVNFYRLLSSSGVRAQCRQVMGTPHGLEIFPSVCPDISRQTARDLAGWIEEIRNHC
ncbi:MAG: esterase [Gammaproteobacteria bacterium]|nr:esterase [Gammaproteobacteria bacterium]